MKLGLDLFFPGVPFCAVLTIGYAVYLLVLRFCGLVGKLI